MPLSNLKESKKSKSDNNFISRFYYMCVEYCVRCCYPENTRPHLLIDEDGVCSACRTYEQRLLKNSDYWDSKKKEFGDILNTFKEKARKNGAEYDCIIPVSGGKDSHYQTYLITQVFKLKPLLVDYNHCYNSRLSRINLNNIVEKFGCDLLRFNTNPNTAKKLSLYMLKKVGDITWHHHSGIFSLPFQTAVRYKIPLVIYGEEGGGFWQGMFNLDDQVEFSQKHRQEIAMRGFEPEDILSDPENTDITKTDLSPFFFPTDEEIESIGVRGIFTSNYDIWDQKKNTELMINDYGFQTYQSSEQTFNLHASIDDFFEGTHNYCKYLKFGYSRCTDHTSLEIRNHRMTRDEAIELIDKYEHLKRPKNLDHFLKFAQITEKDFLQYLEPFRDPEIWEKDSQGNWNLLDWIGNHKNDAGVEENKLPIKEKWSFLTSTPIKEKPINYHYGEDEDLIFL